MQFSLKTLGLIGFLLIGLGLMLFYLLNVSLTGSSASVKELEISAGMSFNEISDKLTTEGLVRSKIVFEIYALVSGQAKKLKPGKYFLTADVSIPKLVETLTKGPMEISAVIFPGMTLKEIDDKLSSLKIIEPSELINFDAHALKEKYPWLIEAEKGSKVGLEGFLLPDTYNFFVGSDINEVVKKFLDNFTSRVLPFFKNYDKLLETINIASILEKEIPDYNERQIVAGILIKRLAVGMPLQVDAGLLYFKCSARFLNCPALKEEDYKIDSAYNTYLHKGLPETPIGNPSIEAIKAALNPQKSNYWYYLSDPKTGNTIFSETLDEHNKNRAKYLLIK